MALLHSHDDRLSAKLSLGDFADVRGGKIHGLDQRTFSALERLLDLLPRHLDLDRRRIWGVELDAQLSKRGVALDAHALDDLRRRV